MYPAAQKWNKGFTGVVFQNNTGWEPCWEPEHYKNARIGAMKNFMPSAALET